MPGKGFGDEFLDNRKLVFEKWYEKIDVLDSVWQLCVGCRCRDWFLFQCNVIQ
jgi:hypothetical protein